MRRLSLLRVAADVAATWRLTELVVDDEVTRPLREAAYRTGNPKMSYFVDCKKCVSVWAGLAVGSGLIPRPVRYGLAMSAATLWIGKKLDLIDSAQFREMARRHGPVQ